MNCPDDDFIFQQQKIVFRRRLLPKFFFSSFSYSLLRIFFFFSSNFFCPSVLSFSTNTKRERIYETILDETAHRRRDDDDAAAFASVFSSFSSSRFKLNRKPNCEGERELKTKNFFFLFHVQIQTITSQV